TTVRIALGILGVFLLMALLAPMIAPEDPLTGSLADRLAPPAWAKGGSLNHILGADDLGRDILSRLIYGARVSMLVAASAIVIAGALGTLVGMTAGYLGGWTDRILMRIVDLALSFPIVMLALLCAALFGPSLINIILVMALVLWAPYARMARGETLRVKTLDYVDLARTAGVADPIILARHILPNISGSLIVLATLQVGTVIILEASLSFLGVGVPPPTPSWGSMVADGRNFIASAWWVSLIPGLAVLAIVLAANLLGDMLADHLNPDRRRETGL
ncbi:MAG TPA: ABC transporter permease, partial [Hyphomonadaceae bacterium]|nr:ABC transporter permease [Hyphomonadaceae bacterium]